jgi:hypothetical protein
MYQLPIEYDPKADYTPQQMRALIEPHIPVICAFTRLSQARRGVWGLDFANYHPIRRMIPILLIPPDAVKNILVPLHGRAFKLAYQSSRVGQGILITYQSPHCSGWFKAGWQEAQTQVYTA